MTTRLLSRTTSTPARRQRCGRRSATPGAVSRGGALRSSTTSSDGSDRGPPGASATSLAALYRDVLVVQMSSDVELVNADLSDLVAKLAHGSRPAETLRRIEAVMACRQAVDENVNPLLAVEAMALALRAG